MSKSQEPLRRKPFISFVALSAAAVLVAGFTYLAQAEERQAKQPPATEEAPAEEVDMFAVPEGGDLEELSAFIDNLQSFQPTTRAEYMNYQENAPDALLSAAELIMEQNPEKDSSAYQMARGVLLQSQLASLFEGEPAERQQYIDEVLTFLKNSKLGIPEARLSMQFAQMLDFLDEPELQVATLEQLVEIFDGQDSPLMAQVAGSFESMLVRAQLVGSVMEITGSTVTGDDFTLEQLRGNVVLVDFWATWCGPCVAEHPNIMRNYEKYHERGFDVVGVSLDDNRQALESYIAEHEVPWTTLFSDDGPNAAAETYGINAIPAMFLIDADGKVISDQARGPELDRLLAEIFDGDDANTEEEPDGSGE